MRRRALRFALALLLAATSAAVAAHDAPTPSTSGCDGFRWNVTAERALFAGPGTPLTAGRSAESAPTLAVGRLAALTLPAQDEVRYAQPPGKTKLADGAHGGLVAFEVAEDGEYRIAISSPHWIDVVDGDRLIASLDFHGANGCAAPRKLVRYRLPAGRPLLIQFSGAVDPALRLSVTPEP